jgi:hypothetical protein
MTQLCIFSAPKPFVDAHIALIQRNAIRSWLALGPQVEVLLVGDEPGVPEVAAELGVRHIRQVQTNTHGTPLVSAIFAAARAASPAPLLAYVNADIVLLPEFLSIVNQMAKQSKDFVLLGQRFDLQLTENLDLAPGWDTRLQAEIAARGKLHSLGGSDYFIFPRHLYTEMPDFAIGRAGWDNWMIFQAIARGWNPIDATPSLTIVHQAHDYSHLNARNHQRHQETEENTQLGGGMRRMFMLLDVPNQLAGGKVRSAPWSLVRALRGLERRLQPDERVGRGWRWLLLRRVRKLRRALAGY